MPSTTNHCPPCTFDGAAPEMPSVENAVVASHEAQLNGVELMFSLRHEAARKGLSPEMILRALGCGAMRQCGQCEFLTSSDRPKLSLLGMFDRAVIGAARFAGII